MKLIAYKIGGQIVGIDLNGWTDSDLNGNHAFLSIGHDDPTPSGYTDISSIVNWDAFGGSAYCPKTGVHLELSDMKIRTEIMENLTDAQLSGNTSGLTTQEIEVLKKYKLDWYYKLYEQFDHLSYDVNVQNSPVDINYNLLGLHKKRYFNKGELYKVEYFKNYNFITDTFSDLVLHEERSYHRFNEMVHRRELNICCHLNTGISGATKQTTKYYTQEESFAAGERRRRNCITNLKIGAVGLIMDLSGITQQAAEEIGWAFLGEFNNEITVFIEGAEQILKDALLATTNHDWLDGKPSKLGYFYTIREYLYGEINIDYTENNTYL